MVLLGTRQHFQNKKLVKVVSTSGVLRCPFSTSFLWQRMFSSRNVVAGTLPYPVHSQCVLLAAVVSVELRASGSRDVITKQAVSCCRVHIYFFCNNCIKLYHRRCVCGGMRTVKSSQVKSR